MTEATVRNCPKCKAKIVKEEGCNKITCRCGGTICYICREPNVRVLYELAVQVIGRWQSDAGDW